VISGPMRPVLEASRQAAAPAPIWFGQPGLSTSGLSPRDLRCGGPCCASRRRFCVAIATNCPGTGSCGGCGRPWPANTCGLLQRVALVSLALRGSWPASACCPVYDVFDERYFPPALTNACLLAVEASRPALGDRLLFCEDLWVEEDVACAHSASPGPIRSLSCCPAPTSAETFGLPLRVQGIAGPASPAAAAAAAAAWLSVVYVNRGGNDGLVFDGASFRDGWSGQVPAANALCLFLLALWSLPEPGAEPVVSGCVRRWPQTSPIRSSNCFRVLVLGCATTPQMWLSSGPLLGLSADRFGLVAGDPRAAALGGDHVEPCCCLSRLTAP